MGCKFGLWYCSILLLSTEVSMDTNITGQYEWNVATGEGNSFKPVTSEPGGSLPSVPAEYELGSQPATATRRTNSLSSATEHQLNSIPIEILDSGIEEVEQYDTVIFFYIQVESQSSYGMNISVSADMCCVFVEQKDTICGQLMVLAPPVILQLDEYTPAQEARFMYRNLYATHRRGNCTFDIVPLGNSTHKWKHLKHAIKFDTYPADYDNTNPTCKGIDLDPDRSCTPVDCVIKYEGLRNFFRNSTKKCEEVVNCDTRGKDGASVVAYFDWEDNACVPLLDDEPTVYVGDIPETKIPIELDPEKNKIIPEFDYARRLELVKTGEYKLQCNHGHQEGGTCVCNDGWRSSGIHATNLLEFNYCDQEDDGGLLGNSYGPRRFTRAVEITIICVMSTAIVVLLLLWFFLAYTLTKASIPKRSRTAAYGLLEEVVPHSLK